MSRYMIVIEQEGDAWGAYAPDLPGLGVAGSSQEEVEQLAQEAVQEHIKLLKELGETVPQPLAQAKFVSVA
jgi:predicted RNase H-like HicB family nuclease